MWKVVTFSYVNGDNMQLSERHRKVTVLSQSCSVLPCNMFMALQCDLLSLWNKQVPEREMAVAHNWCDSFNASRQKTRNKTALLFTNRWEITVHKPLGTLKLAIPRGGKSCIWLKENDLLPNTLLANKQNRSNSLPWRSCCILSWCFDYKTEKMRQTFVNARVGCKRTPCL